MVCTQVSYMRMCLYAAVSAVLCTLFAMCGTYVEGELCCVRVVDVDICVTQTSALDERDCMR